MSRPADGRIGLTHKLPTESGRVSLFTPDVGSARNRFDGMADYECYAALSAPIFDLGVNCHSGQLLDRRQYGH
jgi:hypothetical protein